MKINNKIIKKVFSNQNKTKLKNCIHKLDVVPLSFPNNNVESTTVGLITATKLVHFDLKRERATFYLKLYIYQLIKNRNRLLIYINFYFVRKLKSELMKTELSRLKNISTIFSDLTCILYLNYIKIR